MAGNHYSGSLTREQFLFYEIRTVSSLILQGESCDEIYHVISTENLFQFPTEKMIKSITNTCFKRIDAMNAPELVYHLANASLDVAKQINLWFADDGDSTGGAGRDGGCIPSHDRAGRGAAESDGEAL